MLCFCDYRAMFSVNWDSNDPNRRIMARSEGDLDHIVSSPLDPIQSFPLLACLLALRNGASSLGSIYLLFSVSSESACLWRIVISPSHVVTSLSSCY